MEELKSLQAHVNHLRHCIEEEHNIRLNGKSMDDIVKTMLGANRLATLGCIRHETNKYLRTE